MLNSPTITLIATIYQQVNDKRQTAPATAAKLWHSPVVVILLQTGINLVWIPSAHAIPSRTG